MKANQQMNNCQSFHTILDTITMETPLINENNEEDSGLRPASEVLTKSLIQIFEIVCEQDKPKSGVFHISDDKLSCYNCLQAFLRHTEHAGNVATEMDLFDKVIARFNTISNDIGMSSRDFILKYGDRKKRPIIQELGLLAGLISSWYCRTPMSDMEHVEHLLKCLSNVWDWTFHDWQLHLKFLTLLMVLSEKSLIVCRALSTVQILNQPTFIKRVAEIAKSETKKVKGPNVSCGRLKVAVRILTNCCSCIEGRIQLLKVCICNYSLISIKFKQIFRSTFLMSSIRYIQYTPRKTKVYANSPQSGSTFTRSSRVIKRAPKLNISPFSALLLANNLSVSVSLH